MMNQPDQEFGSPRRRSIQVIASVICVVCALSPSAQAADEATATYTGKILPILDEFCIDCHSTDRPKGELDLERFASINDVRKHPSVWESVLAQLADGEMPPKKKRQPTAQQKQQLMNWVRSTLDAMALANAGDPGTVVLRRLSNREYTYTIRDLTGVASLDPAKEFPIDGAAGEGFTNVGSALVMSPALLTKYLDAMNGLTCTCRLPYSLSQP